MHKKTSVFNLSENVASALSYALLFFSGIVILVMERENKTVRFHALQSTLWFMTLMVLSWVLGFLARIPLLGLVFGLGAAIVGFIIFVSWLFLMFMAFSGKKFKLPIIGEVVESQVER